MRTCIIALMLVATSATAEPLRLRTASTVKTDGGSELRLPAGYFLEDELWEKLDAEVRRLQAVETSLKTENSELRQAIENSTAAPLVMAVSALALGLIVGAAVF